MNKRGVTLVELMVVISVIGILAAALAFSYQGWMGKYNVEKVVKDLYSDLMFAKAEAVMKNHIYFADFPDNLSYRIVEDTDDSGAPASSGDTIEVPPPPALLPSTAKKTLNYQIIWTTSSGLTLAKAQIAFDKRGMIWIYDKTAAPPITLQAPSPLPLPSQQTVVNISSTSNPDYDCVTLTQTRILMGQTPRDASNNPIMGKCNVK